MDVTVSVDVKHHVYLLYPHNSHLYVGTVLQQQFQSVFSDAKSNTEDNVTVSPEGCDGENKPSPTVALINWAPRQQRRQVGRE